MVAGIGGQAPGALHHIAIRGIERKAVFTHQKDYDDFLDRMGSILRDSSTGCSAWALMTNHLHLSGHRGRERNSEGPKAVHSSGPSDAMRGGI